MKYFLLFMCIHLPYCQSHPCTVTYDAHLKGEIANCNNRNLQQVPHDLPSSIVRIILSYNKLSQLSTHDFVNYSELIELDLSNNNIANFQQDCFQGISNLSKLDLSQNKFAFDEKTFNKNVFKPLNNLLVLRLDTKKFIPPSTSFPSNVLQDLTHLQNVTMNTWPDEKYRYAFAHLRDLKSLGILGQKYCNLQIIRNNTFEVLNKLKIESLQTDCLVIRVDLGALVPLSKLQDWTFYSTFGSSLSLRNVTALLKPFIGKHMKLVDLDGVQEIRKTSIIDIDLNRETLGPLLDICLDTLVISRNRLQSISCLEIKNSTFVKCLKYFYASENHFEADHSCADMLPRLQNLKLVDASRIYPLVDTLNKTHLYPIGLYRYKQHNKSSIPFPPNLEQILHHAGGSQLDPLSGYVTLLNTSKLWKLDLSATGNYSINGYIKGLSYLKYLDLSMNTVEGSFFQNSDIENLETFKAEHSSINFQFTKSITYKFKRLKNLSLAFTNLDIIPVNTMRNLARVQCLILRGNRLDDIPDEIFHMPSLKHLDMSETAIRSLSDNTRSKLDELNTLRGSFRLDISGNIFMCSCYTLGFIEWIYESQIVLDNERNYQCLRTDGTSWDTASFHNDHLHQWRKCIGPALFTASLVLVLTSALMMTATALLQRFFPRIQHDVLRILGYDIDNPLRRTDFRYDAYICYDDSDYQWSFHCLYNGLMKTNRNLRLYLHDIHSIPGEAKAESIIEAISQSWKVVVVLSEKSFSDEWFYFSIMSAVRLLSSQGAITSRIILIYEVDTPEVRANIPDFLVNVMKESNVVSSQEAGFSWLQISQMIFDQSGPDLFINYSY